MTVRKCERLWRRDRSLSHTQKLKRIQNWAITIRNITFGLLNSFACVQILTKKISHSLLTPTAATTNPLFCFHNQVMLTASKSLSFLCFSIEFRAFYFFHHWFCFCSVLLVSTNAFGFVRVSDLAESEYYLHNTDRNKYKICIDDSTPKFEIACVWFRNKNFLRVFCTVEKSVGKLMVIASIQYSTICVPSGKICVEGENELLGQVVMNSE